MLNLDIIKGFLILGLIFIPLEKIFSLHRQKILRKGWRLDIFYFFTGSFLSKLSLLLSASIAILITNLLSNESLKSTINHQTYIVRFFEALLIAEIGYYFAHRLFHTIPYLWNFHQIHHSVKELDWLTAVRVHPVEQIATKLCQMIPLYFLGFSTEVLATFFLFSAGMAFFIHSNIRVKFPYLNYLIVTPEYHHWHHEINKNNYNYSAQLPLMDCLFGTFYLPKHKQSKIYGITDLIPVNYWQQFIYPFRQLKNFKNMINKTTKLSLPLIILMVFSVSVLTAGIAIPLTTHMSVPTFISSLNSDKITPEELRILRENNPNSLILIDVRSPEEYQQGHIEGSILIPLSDIEAGFGIKQISKLVTENPNSTIVLYCSVGVRSLKAYHVLQKNSIKTVNLQGGIKAWNKLNE